MRSESARGVRSGGFNRRSRCCKKCQPKVSSPNGALLAVTFFIVPDSRLFERRIEYAYHSHQYKATVMTLKTLN